MSPTLQIGVPYRSGISHRRTDMKFKLVFVVFPLLLLGTPIYGQIDQSLCVQCLTAAQDKLKKCLDEAISHEDKTSCAERQAVRTKTCEDGECKIERGAEKGSTPKPLTPSTPVTGALPPTSAAGPSGAGQVCIREHRTQQIMCGEPVQ